MLENNPREPMTKEGVIFRENIPSLIVDDDAFVDEAFDNFE